MPFASVPLRYELSEASNVPSGYLAAVVPRYIPGVSSARSTRTSVRDHGLVGEKRFTSPAGVNMITFCC